MVSEMAPSGIRAFFDLVVGKPNVIKLAVGEPDFSPPWHVIEAVIDSLYAGFTSYSSNQGLLRLREEIAQYLDSRFGIMVDPEKQVLVTTGVSEAIDIALRALLEPGDEVIVTQPCYVSYAPCVELAYGKPVIIECRPEDGWQVDPERLEAACNERTKALLINYPCNPTGATLSKEVLERLVELAVKWDFVILSDEVYAELTFEGDHTAVGSLPGAADHVLTLSGFSKAWAMTGLRLGYAAGPTDIIAAMTKIHQYTMLCAPITAQIGGIEALAGPSDEMRQQLREYGRRRRVFCAGLKELGFPLVEPSGTFYAFPDIRWTGLSSQEFCKQLLMEKEVATVPGDAFGTAGDGYIRCAFATSIGQLEEALRRIKDFLAAL